MSVESKLDKLITVTGLIAEAQAANQSAVLNAIKDITPGDNSAIVAALVAIESQVTTINATLGTEAPVAPVVSGVSPNTGVVAGGDSITIVGSGFTAATAVNFGGTPAASFSVASDSMISAVTPANAAGTVEVTVVTAGGTSVTSPVDQFTYA